jgi:hypothetical protein
MKAEKLMAKYEPKTYPSDTIKMKNHWAVGTVWGVIGSRGNNYNVEFLDKGFSCDCPAFKKCKHIKKIEEAFNV